jgi:putative SOS response-associated peptidase YedK
MRAMNRLAAASGSRILEPATEEELLALLKPCPDHVLKIWPVDKAVGNVKNKGPQLAMAV